MNNRQRIMLKLIGLSDEEFADLLGGTLPALLGSDLPASLRERENCGSGTLAEWLSERVR